MTTPINIQPMGIWQLLLNNPEWVSVLASSLFAIVTIGVVTWQVYVMKAQVRVMRWQGRTSARHEHNQNRLIRLQHEHEWVFQRNQDRGLILELTRKLRLAVAGWTDGAPTTLEGISFGEVLDTARELDARLNILDVATFSGFYDQWFPNLKQYVEAVLQAVIEEPNVQYPSPETKKKLNDAAERHDPTKIYLDIQAAIRMEFFDFKNKWDALLL